MICRGTKRSAWKRAALIAIFALAAGCADDDADPSVGGPDASGPVDGSDSTNDVSGPSNAFEEVQGNWDLDAVVTVGSQSLDVPGTVDMLHQSNAAGNVVEIEVEHGAPFDFCGRKYAGQIVRNTSTGEWTGILDNIDTDVTDAVEALKIDVLIVTTPNPDELQTQIKFIAGEGFEGESTDVCVSGPVADGITGILTR